MFREKRELEVIVESPWMLAVAILKWYTDRNMTAYIYMTPQRKYCLRSRLATEPPYKGEDTIVKAFGNVSTWRHKGMKKDIKKLELRYPMTLKVII